MTIAMRRVRAMQTGDDTQLRRTLIAIESEAADVADQIVSAMAYKLNPVSFVQNQTYFAKPWDRVIAPNVTLGSLVLPEPSAQLTGVCIGVFAPNDSALVVTAVSGLVRGSDVAYVGFLQVILLFCDGAGWW